MQRVHRLDSVKGEEPNNCNKAFFFYVKEKFSLPPLNPVFSSDLMIYMRLVTRLNPTIRDGWRGLGSLLSEATTTDQRQALGGNRF